MSATLFDVLNKISKKEYDAWLELTSAEQAQYHPLVLMKWCISSGLDPIRLQQVNNNFFSHAKDTQMRLLATVERHPRTRRWVWKRKKDVNEQANKAVRAIQLAHSMDRSTAESVVGMFSEQELEILIAEYDDSTSQKTKRK